MDAFERTRPLDAEAGAAREGGCPLRQARLPDAAFARDGQRPAVPGLDCRDQPKDLVDLPAAPDERSPARRGVHGPTLPTRIAISHIWRRQIRSGADTSDSAERRQMQKETAMYELKNLNQPEETRRFEKGRVEVVAMAGGTVGKGTFEPGWKWSDHVKPLAKTEWCQGPHFQYTVAGRLHVKMEDGSEFEVGPGEVVRIPPGHDAWVVGDEPLIVIDWAGLETYGKQA
jgi:quercetin dioxygenase-like cupin family protein